MLPGDIIQFDCDEQLSKWWQKLLNKLVKKFDGDVNHSALYLSKNYVVEAIDGHGVRKRRILKQEKYHVLRIKPELKLENLERNLKDYYSKTKGMKYSWSDWVNASIVKIFGKQFRLFKNDKEGFICSEYIQDFFWRYYGIDLCENTQTETPNDFDTSQYLYRT